MALISDTEWEWLAARLPPPEGRRGRPAFSHRTMLDAITLVMRTDMPWMSMPEHFGAWNTVYRRYWRWRRNGLFSALLDEIETTRTPMSPGVAAAIQAAARGARVQARERGPRTPLTRSQTGAESHVRA